MIPDLPGFRALLGVAPDGKLAVLEALLAGESGLENLVGASGLPRRDVEEFLAALDDLDGDREKLFASYQASRAVVRPEDEPALKRAAASLIADAPAPRKRFDHVQATPGTLVRRVKWLTDRFDLAGRSVFFAGDHDLTSLLLARVVPDAQLTVADIHEDLLAYIDSAGGGRVRCGWADFRFGLPPALAESADVVFTDPPYTPEGLGLFLSRSVSALSRDDPGARIVVAYGHSRRRPDLGAAAQSEIARQNVVIDAMIPGFNRYDGGQAVGSASDLYCLQPAPSAFRCGGATPLLGIYTHGSQSVEGSGSSAADLAPLLARLAAAGTVGVVSPGSAAFSSIAVRIGLGKLLSDGVHPSVTSRAAEIVVDLRDDPGPWLARAMLALNAPRSVFVIPGRHETLARLMSGTPEWMLPRAKFTSLSPTPLAGESVAIRCELADDAVADDPGLALARFVARRAHGRLRNVWREGLVAVSAASGTPLTKRAAAERVDEAAAAVGIGDDLPLRLIDVPAARFPSLHAALRSSATA
ncbi:MAG: bis-aminopropyl spermidine synthase family protein [Nocardiopsaceae bacterium]|nr:bis-aminopropyl spermidine synthase family protein [Nocardiopsaceae bacterium]